MNKITSAATARIIASAGIGNFLPIDVAAPTICRCSQDQEKNGS